MKDNLQNQQVVAAKGEGSGLNAPKLIAPPDNMKALETRLQQQAVVTSLGLIALADGDLQQLMDKAVLQLKEVLEVEYTKILELLPGGEHMVLKAGLGWQEHIKLHESQVDTGADSQAGFTLACKQPVIVKDLNTETRFNGPALLRQHLVISGMSCIIWGRNSEPYGVLGIHSIYERNFSNDDIIFLQAVANVVAAAIQRKEVELSLQQANDKLNLALSSAQMGIFVIDASLDKATWDNQAAALLGISNSEGSYNQFLDIVFEADRQMVQDVIFSTLHSGQDYLVEFRVGGVNNTFKWILLKGKATHDAQGLQGRLTGVVSDITGRKNAEEALVKSEGKFRTLADNIPNLCWMADASGDIYWYNSRWYDYTGTNEKEMKNLGWQKVHDPAMLQQVVEKWKHAIQTNTAVEMVFPIRGADGVFRPFLTRVVPVKDSNGKVLHWFGTNTDITERENLARQKDEFLSIASHELKTPVTSIKGFIQLIDRMYKQGCPPESMGNLLHKAESQVNKLASLINELLDVSKIQDGKLEYNFDSFLVKPFLEECIAHVEHLSPKNRIAMQGALSISLYGDRLRLEQVVCNLLTNAIKYSPDDTPVTIDVVASGKDVVITVQDKGIGIPEEMFSKIFDRFYRIEASSRQYQGVGLGLYICAEVVKRHNGTIGLRSKKAEGSSFYFSLPQPTEVDAKS